MQKLTQQDRETRVSGETGLYRLRVFEKGVLVRAHLVRSPSVTIGRVAECEIQVENGWLSRKHAQLDLLAPGVVRVRDLGSRNGIFAEGQRIEQREFRSNFAFNVGGEVKIEVEFLSEVVGLIPEGEMVP
ncbi:MAG: FHA domain-containing protein [Planctomycetes bacterium]|nr:FHA domain-containing protein [Planctomycetota bacterium]MBM4080745.1 FHA domain-containing protein [Planctomycetota bacterium]